MPKLIIQVNGETVRKVEGKLPQVVEVRSSDGPIGEFHPEGQARINIVYADESVQDFSTHIDEVNEAPVEETEEQEEEREEQQEEANKEEAPNLKSVPSDGGFSLPTE